MDNGNSDRGPPGSPSLVYINQSHLNNVTNDSGPPASPGLIYASQSHLNNNNNASSASTSRTGVTPSDVSGHLYNANPQSPPSISPPASSDVKIGIYGWRKRCLYLLILVIFIVAMLNLALTVWIIRVVHLSPDGLGPVEISDDSVLISGDAEFLGAIHASEIKGVSGAPLVVESANRLKIQAIDQNYNSDGSSCSRMTLDEDRMSVSTDDLWVKNCAGDTLLRARTGADLEIGAVDEEVGVNVVGDGGATFKDGVITSKIEAPSTENLDISSRMNRIDISGTRGVGINAKFGGISLSAMDDVTIASKRGKLIFDAELRMMDLPLVGNEDKDSEIEAYQLCVCNDGRLYLAGAKDFCGRNSDLCA